MSSADATPPVASITPTVTAARRRIAAAAGAALLVAGLVLVLFVLPAEFAVDPLGSGRLTGLLDLGVTGQQVASLQREAANRQASGDPGGGAASTTGGDRRQSVIVAADVPLQHETVTFTLAPHEGMEYKYRLAGGESLLFSWAATVPVNFEAHAEPDGAPRGYAESYEKGTAQRAAGTLTTPFPGIHGWFWENTTGEPITVTLTTAGHYTLSHEFRTGQPTRNKPFS